MDAVDRFAVQAAEFEEWARRGTAEGERATREALVQLMRLYLAALDLPPAWSEELTDQPQLESIGTEEWRDVASACNRFPLAVYAEVFDPFADPPQDPVAGLIPDDISDIYRDVVTGLRAYRAGRRSQALWQWAFNFRHHWGEHVTSALRAFDCWFRANASDALAAENS